MPYRRTENVVRKLAARHDAIMAAAREIATEGGMAALQIVPVAERAGIATGTVYRYFPSKAELVAALVAALAERERAVLEAAAKAAPGPLSALAAAITTFAARALAQRRLAFALMCEPVEAEVDRARLCYRHVLAAEFEKLIRSALEAGRLPEQDAALAAPALVGTMMEGLIGTCAPAVPADPGQARARVQMLTLFALRALGVVDARARGLVVQTEFPEPSGGDS
ncbi:MAG: TetR/AcrR family transcriptional regulator [Alphaproteobacteria bacterium]|nr:MAG: TetR/AcrR family transcriptional regulator [Alphaproteobacteria bacterium]